MAQSEITPFAVVRSLGMGLAAGALFVFTAMAAEQSIISRFSGRLLGKK